MNDIEALIQDLTKKNKEAKQDANTEAELLRLQEIAALYEGDDKIVSSLDIAAAMKERPPERKLHTGLTKFDAILDGFRLKQLIVLAGITKHGKTSFAIDLTVRLAHENPMWLPFEEPAEEIIQKFIDRNDPIPVFYTPARMKGNTLDWIERKIVEAKAKFDAKLVFIDHLHFIVQAERGESHEQAIARTVRTLKRLAVKWNVAIVLLSHLRKVNLDKNPDLEDIKDSSATAQEADTVLFIWRETVKGEQGETVITNNTNLSVQANRRTGKTGNVKLVYSNGRYIEHEWKKTDPALDRAFGDILP